MLQKIAKFSRSEDVALINAYVSITCDPVIGKYQQCKEFWSQIKTEYKATSRSDPVRTTKSLQTRVSTLKREIKRYVSHIRGCFRNMPSGFTLETAYSICQLDYEEYPKYGNTWRHDDVFQILKNYTLRNSIQRFMIVKQ